MARTRSDQKQWSPLWAKSCSPDDLAIVKGQVVQAIFKQWGGIRKATTGRELDGRTWDEYPASLVSE